MSKRIPWRKRINQAIERANAALEDAGTRHAGYLLSKAGRILNWKLNRRLARLTPEQFGFWSGAFADAIAGSVKTGLGNSAAEERKATENATETAWEKVYERWPDLRGKV